MKKGKVTQVQSNGTWEGNYGMMYKFEITFENGDCGEYSSKSEQQTKFVEGQEVEYEFTGGKFPKVKPFYAPPQSNGQSFLKAAVDYCRGSNCSPEEVCESAQLFAEWVMEKKMDVINETNNEIKENNDDLPF